jgi:hypothetical protein
MNYAENMPSSQSLNAPYNPPTKPSGINFNPMGSAIVIPENKPKQDE